MKICWPPLWALAYSQAMKQFIKNVFATAIGLFLGSCLLLLIMPVVIAVIVKMAQGGGEPIEDKSIFRLKLHGRLVEKSHPLDFDVFSRSFFSDEDRGSGLYELTQALALAKKDPRIKGLYLELGDLQAGWASVTALRRAIEDFATSKKFVYAYAEVLSERTFFLATAAEKVILQPNGDLEFNGLAISEPFFKGLLEKLDIQMRIFRVGKFKAAIEPFILEKMSEENRQQNQALVDDMWKVAVAGFTQSKKLTAESLNQIADRLEVTSADDALERGLVTDLLFEDEVLDMMAEKTVGKDEDPKFVTTGQLLREDKTRMKSEKTKIAVIFAEGEIRSGTGDLDTIGSDSFVEDLDEARKDENVKAIVVRINSPGGDALASDVIWRELAITDQEIPVVASLSDVAASGGYYMAVGARHIVAEQSTITGSIGVFGVLFDTEKFFHNKLGVNFDRVVSHSYSDIGNSNRVMSDFEKQKIQRGVTHVYDRFVNVVRDGRKLPEQSDSGLFAEGRVWSGKRALDLKLVDEIGGLDTAVRKAAELAQLKSYVLDLYPREEEPIQRMLEMFAGEAVRVALRGTILGEAMISRVAAKAQPGFFSKSGIYARLPYDIHVQ